MFTPTEENIIKNIMSGKTAKYLFSSPGGFAGFKQSISIAHAWGFKGGAPFIILGGAYAAMHAPAGHAISQGIGTGVGFGITSLIAGTTAGILTGGNPIAVAAASVIAQALGGEKVDKAIAGVIQPIVDFGSEMRRQRFGGDYRDTQMAVTMRQAAAREMSRSLMNARQWLGQESAFLAQ